MADQGMMTNVGAQAACCILAVAAVLYAKLKELDRRAVALACLREDSDSYLESAKIVLSDPATPTAVRRMVLLALQTVGSREIALNFFQFLAEGHDRRMKVDDPDHPLDQAIRQLQASRPDLAEHAQEATFGLLFCAPIMYADKFRVEVVREGATRPAQIWARLGGAAAKLWPEGPATTAAEEKAALPLFASHA